jgi:cytochrome c
MLPTSMSGWFSERWWLALVALLLMGTVGVACAAADAARGVDVYKSECAECHSVKEGRNKKGPPLFQVVGRPVAQTAGFAFSDALKNTGWIWDDAHLRAYLDKPVSKSNPGGKMKYDGLRDPQALDDLLAYLQTLK